SERWRSQTQPTQSVTSPATPLNGNYYDQVSETFSATTKNGTALSSSNYVTAQYGQFGRLLNSTAAIYDQHDLTDWADVGSTATLDQTSNGSGRSERWQSQAQPTQSVTSPATPLNGNYYDQVGETFSATTKNGTPLSSSNYVTAQYDQFGSLVNSTAAIYDQHDLTDWADVGSTATLDQQSSGSSASERWRSQTQPTQSVTSPATPLNGNYYDQVSETFSATTKNGTPLSSSNYVTAQYDQFGSPVDSTAAIYDQHDLTDWADVGSTATLDQQSSGSSASERWRSQTQPTQTVTSPASPLNGNYFDQLAETFQATTANGGTPMNSTNYVIASYTVFNDGLTVPIYDGTPATEWADRASTVTFSADSSGSSSTERWQYNAHGDEPTFTVSDNTPLAAVYYDQLKLTVVSPHDTPSSKGTAFGSTSAGTAVYDDRGSTANATLTSGSVVEGGIPYSFINWTGDASGTGLVSNNITIDGAKTATASWKSTSSFSNLSSPTITYGTATTLVSGNIAAGSLIPPGGESVSITINSVTQTASIGSNGDFSSTFDTHALGVAKYTISYVYAGDGNFTAAAGSGTLTVSPAFIFTPATLPVATVGDAYSQQLTVSGGSGSGYSLAATGLPAGLSLTTLGLLSGTPTTAMGMPYTVDVTVTDGDGDTGGQIYPLTVKAAAVPGKIVSSPAHPYYGQEVTLTASFSATPAGSASMTGTVAFYDGNTYLGTEPLITSSAAALPAATVFMAAASPMVSGTSSLPTSSLSMGKHIITAVYSGDANYSTASTESSVSVQVVPAVTSVTLIASTTPQGTTLTAAVVVTSPGNPPAVGTVTFYDPGTPLGTVTVSNGVASLNVGVLSPGTYTFSAVFSGGGTFADSQSSLVVSTDGPKVTSVLRYGFHWQPTYLLINFNGPLDPTSAQNPSNYQILGPGGHRITVVSAIYDPATQTVTLVPAGRLNIHWKYRLTVNGTAPSGLTNPSGILLDGAGNGKPGSNYVTSITWRNLAGKASKLPTLVLVHAAPPRPVVTHTPPQHPKAALHTLAVDHLLVTESLHVRGVLRARR
ncbi:MAG: Ig-like domain-containing protein, partial [Isosphaeraceae bacterium]